MSRNCFFLRRRKISAMIKLNIRAYLKGIDGFTRYLISDKCALFNAEKRSPTQSTQIKRFRTFFGKNKTFRHGLSFYTLFHFVLS